MKTSYYDTVEEALKDADICFIFTEWSEVKRAGSEPVRQTDEKAHRDGRPQLLSH